MYNAGVPLKYDAALRGTGLGSAKECREAAGKPAHPQRIRRKCRKSHGVLALCDGVIPSCVGDGPTHSVGLLSDGHQFRWPAGSSAAVSPAIYSLFSITCRARQEPLPRLARRSQYSYREQMLTTFKPTQFTPHFGEYT